MQGPQVLRVVPRDWRMQFIGRVRDGLDERLRLDLDRLMDRNARSAAARHPLAAYIPDAFSKPLMDDSGLSGPGFGAGLVYDGRRFRGLSGAGVEEGVLHLGIRAAGLEREIVDTSAGHEVGMGYSGLAVLVDFLTRITDGPVGEVVGRMNNELHRHGHPMLRCGDGRVRLLHTMGRHRYRDGGFRPLPDLIPVSFLEARDDVVADLDEDGLRDWAWDFEG